MDAKIILDEIILAVKEAGKIIINANRTPEMVDEKEGRANFVTTYDKEVQKFLNNKLLEILPEAVFVGEEEESNGIALNGYSFIVDPIDGTTNFIKDYHVSCISVGLLKDAKPFIGLVFNPYLDETFTAIKGEGAYLNGKRIKVSNQSLENGIVIFGTAPYYPNLSKKSFELAYEYFEKSLDIRRSGSAAIDLCNIACGRAELFFELCLSPWDFAAGSLIVEEAGGIVTTIEGHEIDFSNKCSILAKNK